MKNTFKDNIESLGLSYKKTLTIIAIVNALTLVASAAVFLFMKKVIVLLIALGVLLFINFYLIMFYSSLKDKQEQEQENEFVTLISYFQIFIINNKNVYNAFRALLPYASKWSETKIKELLDKIDVDKSVKPFVDFASNYKTKIVQSIMLSIYQMVDQGENNSQINQFTILFDNLNREKKLLLISQKQRALEGMNIFPLFGAGYITLLLTFSLLTNVGEIMHGI